MFLIEKKKKGEKKPTHFDHLAADSSWPESGGVDWAHVTSGEVLKVLEGVV